MTPSRQTADLGSYPDLVVIYLGMRVNVITGIKTLLGTGPQIDGSVTAKPEGLLLHEYFLFSLFPTHLGTRQYWRDFESLERWSHSEPHRIWWKNFLRDTGGTAFWHELHSVRSGFESVYIGLEKPIGFLRFATSLPAKGSLFSARSRLGRAGTVEKPSPVTESDLEAS
jgi:hypothetical protein